MKSKNARKLTALTAVLAIIIGTASGCNQTDESLITPESSEAAVNSETTAEIAPPDGINTTADNYSFDGDERISYNIFISLQAAGFPIISSGQGSGGKIFLGFAVPDEELPDIQLKFESFLKNDFESKIELRADMFALEGGGPTVYIPVDELDDTKRGDLPELVVDNVTREGLYFKFMNGTDKEFFYGDEYVLYVKQGDVWKRLNYGEIFNAVAYTIAPNSQTEEQPFIFPPLLSELPDGEYRFEKGVILDSEYRHENGLELVDYRLGCNFTLK